MKSVTTCSHSQATHASLIRPSFLQWLLPSEGRADPERAYQREFPLCHQTQGAFTPRGSVCSASPFPLQQSDPRHERITLAATSILYFPK